jgi:thiamine biosynthesis lipoprotein
MTSAPTLGPACGETTRFTIRAPRAETIERTFAALGTQVRIAVTARRAATLVARAEREILEYDERLSRFRPDSELCALNADPREEVPASALLREAVRAALWAASASDGLVDPTLLDALERAGYTESLAGKRERPWVDAGRRTTDVRGPARANPAALWRRIEVGDASISRPRGIRLDLGGSGKGHVADRVADLLAGAHRWFVDCGGDIRVGGAPQEVHVAHPLTGEIAARYEIEDGAIATSSIVGRSWITNDGRIAHHLLDPSTGEPVNTGVLAATALGRTTLEAETRAKVALLTGRGGDLVFTR